MDVVARYISVPGTTVDEHTIGVMVTPCLIGL